MEQRLENKLKELKERYERRLETSERLEIGSYSRMLWLAKAEETLEQIELLKEIKE